MYFLTLVQDNSMCFMQGRNEGGAKGAQFPGRQITVRALNHCGRRRKVPTMSQVLSSTQ